MHTKLTDLHLQLSAPAHSTRTVNNKKYDGQGQIYNLYVLIKITRRPRPNPLSLLASASHGYKYTHNFTWGKGHDGLGKERLVVTPKVGIWNVGGFAEALRGIVFVGGGCGGCIIARSKENGSVFRACSCAGCAATGVYRVAGGEGCVPVGCVVVVARVNVLRSLGWVEKVDCEDFPA